MENNGLLVLPGFRGSPPNNILCPMNTQETTIEGGAFEINLFYNKLRALDDILREHINFAKFGQNQNVYLQAMGEAQKLYPPPPLQNPVVKNIINFCSW